MNYIEFNNQLKPFGVFSLTDIEKIFPNFDKRRLFEWKQKGYISKIKRAYYYFSDIEIKESFLYRIANKIYHPSYISMESALSYYGFIPEGIFTITSICTMNTAKQETELGLFSYQHVKPKLFFGYTLMQINGITIKVAEPEKAILDYLYLGKIQDIEDLNALRFNLDQLKERLDYLKLESYSTIYGSKVLNQRIKYFKNIIDA